jgi:hypothetical protein
LRAQQTVANQLMDAGIEGFPWRWLTSPRMAPVWWLCTCMCRAPLEFDEGYGALVGRCHHCGTEISLSVDRAADYIALGRILPRIGLFDMIEGIVGDILCGVTYMSSSIHSLVYGLVSHELGFRVLPQIFVDITGSFGTPIEVLHDSGRRPRFATGLTAADALVVNGRASSLYYLARTDMRQLVDRITLSTQVADFDSPVRF